MIRLILFTFFLIFIPLKSFASQLEIVASGFNSCKLFSKQLKGEKGYLLRYRPTPINSNMYNAFFSNTNLKRKHFFISCFTGLIGAEKLYFINSDQPNFVQTVEVNSYADIIKDFIENHIDDPIDNVKIIGHSHGGWLSMTIVPILSKIIEVNKLITIDPISFNNCTRKTIIEQQLRRLKLFLLWPFEYKKLVKKCVIKMRRLESITRREAKRVCKATLKENGIERSLKKYFEILYNDPKDSCLSAPWEIDDSSIANQVDYWINYYQEKSFFLHSSIYENADENIFKENNHIEIDTNKEIWEEFSKNKY